jgi:hypothetical protein
MKVAPGLFLRISLAKITISISPRNLALFVHHTKTIPISVKAITQFQTPIKDDLRK